MVSHRSSLIDEVYSITNYKFKNESLLSEVFKPTKNVTNPWSYERLEFLGDSILNLVVSIILFELRPLEKEGHLTLRKNDLVSGHTLSEVCKSLSLMRLIPETSVKSVWRESDTVEALVGAIFLDGGFRNAKNFVSCIWKKLARKQQSVPVDAKTRLYIWAQKRQLPPPDYQVTDEFQEKGIFTITLKLKGTHGYGTVKVTNELKKRGEILAAELMLGRIDNREKWKKLLKSEGEFITEEDLIKSCKDLKMRLNLWCKAHKTRLPVFGTIEKKNEGKVKYTSSVMFGNGRIIYGTSSNKTAAERKAMLRALLDLCDEERESRILKNKTIALEIDLCTPRNFKSLLDEWVTKNRVGQISYSGLKLVDQPHFNVSLTIVGSDLGTVWATSRSKRLGEQQVAGLMIEKTISVHGSRQMGKELAEEDLNNYKNELYKWTQSRRLPKPEYKVVNVTGLGHNLLFTVSVSVEGLNSLVSSGYTKQSAQQRVARSMLNQIKSSIE